LSFERDRTENLEIEKLQLELVIERDRVRELELAANDASRRELGREEAMRQQRLTLVDTELEIAKLETACTRRAAGGGDGLPAGRGDRVPVESSPPLSPRPFRPPRPLSVDSPTTSSHSFKVLNRYYPAAGGGGGGGGPGTPSPAGSGGQATAKTHSFKMLKGRPAGGNQQGRGTREDPGGNGGEGDAAIGAAGVSLAKVRSP